MKSIRIMVIMSMIIPVVIISGCGEDKDPIGPDTSIPAELVAIWTYQSASINQQEINLGIVLQWQEGTVSARFTVSDNGTFVNEELDIEETVQWTESGTFTVDGNNATITITSDSDGPVEPPDIMSGTWALNGNLLTLTTTLEGLTVMIVAAK